MPTAEWSELHDHHNAKGEPLPPEPDGPLDDLWSDLTVAQQQLVASGRITLEELVDRVTAASNAELCPRCCRDTISPVFVKLGLCAACARKARNEALEAKLSELDAQREADMLKQRLHRARVELGLPLPRAQRSDSEETR